MKCHKSLSISNNGQKVSTSTVKNTNKNHSFQINNTSKKKVVKKIASR